MILEKRFVFYIFLFSAIVSCSPVVSRLGRSAGIAQVESESLFFGLHASDAHTDSPFYYPSLAIDFTQPINQQMDYSFGVGIANFSASLRRLLTSANNSSPIIISCDAGASYSFVGNNTSAESMLRINLSPQSKYVTPYFSYSFHYGRYNHWEDGDEMFGQHVIYIGLEKINNQKKTIELTYSWPSAIIRPDIFDFDRHNISLNVCWGF